MRGLGELGWSFDIIGDIAKGVTGAVVTGAVPDNADAINRAISQGVDLAVAHQVATPATAVAQRPAYTAASVAKVGIPIGMVALIAGAALLMSGKGKGKYRSNPSRRYHGHRRGRRGRSGSSFLEKNMVPLGIAGAGIAAFMMFKKPVAVAAAAAYPSALPQVAATATPGTAQPSGIAKIASDFTNTVMSWFGAGTKPAAPPEEDWRKGMVLSLDQTTAGA
jgi:hypothetical protein